MRVRPPQPNKLIRAMQQLMNKEPARTNKLAPATAQTYLGTWMAAEALDANLSIVQLQGGEVVHFVPKIATVTLVAGDVVKLERSGAIGLHIIGKMVGDISLANGVIITAGSPTAPTGLHIIDTTTSSYTVAYTAGVDHFGSGLVYNVYNNQKFAGTTKVNTLSGKVGGLKPATEYQCTISSRDGQGLISPFTNVLLVTTDGTAPSPPGTTHTKSYSCVAARSYNFNSNGENDSWHNQSAYQGTFAGSGNQSGLLFFDDAQIRADIPNGSVTKMTVTITFAHTGLNAGVRAFIGTASYKSGGAPSHISFANCDPQIMQPHCTAGAAKTVSLGAAVGNQFASGSRSSILIGPATAATVGSGSYGYVYATGSHRAKVTLTWVS